MISCSARGPPVEDPIARIPTLRSPVERVSGSVWGTAAAPEGLRFLSTIPWTKEMRNIPTIAYGHHEKLSGDGYPRGINSTEIPIQTRMMTVSDIYDALTASDRPYKRAVPTPKALDILNVEVKEQKLDAELVKVFIESKIWEKKEGAPAGS